MNARGDAGGRGKTAGIQKPDRIGAFAAAIPKNTQLVEGLEPPHEQGKPASGGMHEMEMGAQQGDAAFALDDFMNLDGMDENSLPFDEHFNF